MKTKSGELKYDNYGYLAIKGVKNGRKKHEKHAPTELFMLYQKVLNSLKIFSCVYENISDIGKTLVKVAKHQICSPLSNQN